MIIVINRTNFVNSNNDKMEYARGDVSEIIEVPFFDVGISAGFPSPANDFEELTISFDKEVFGTSPSTTFCARVKGTSMIGAGIDTGDILVIDRIIEPKDGKIALCVIDNEFTLKRLKVEPDCIWLVPENDEFQPIQVVDNDNFYVWGMLTYVLKKFI